MPTPSSSRHRAAAPSTASHLAKAISLNSGKVGRRVAVVAAASGLVLVSSVAAHADTVQQPAAAQPASQSVAAGKIGAVTAPLTAKVDFKRTPVASKAAPKVAAPVAQAPVEQAPTAQPAVQVQEAPAAKPVAQTPVVRPAAPKPVVQAPVAQAPVAPKPVAQAPVAQQKAAPKPVAQAPVAQAAVAPKPVAPAPVAQQKASTVTSQQSSAKPAASSGSNAAIASAALAQLGVTQDCTALASNALAAVGINFHGWPADYMKLGHTVSAAQAQPGDLIYYANGGMGMAHIAVYIGNGMAVHGGWEGNKTTKFSAYVGSGPVFIHVDR